MRASIAMEGLSALLDTLEDMDEAALYAAAARGMQEGLIAAAGDAAELCPKDTGALAASIGVSSDGRSASLVASSPYAVYVEMGTWAQPARPFLYPALQANRAKIMRGAAAAVRSLMREGKQAGRTEQRTENGTEKGGKRADTQ